MMGLGAHGSTRRDFRRTVARPRKCRALASPRQWGVPLLATGRGEEPRSIGRQAAHQERSFFGTAGIPRAASTGGFGPQGMIHAASITTTNR